MSSGHCSVHIGYRLGKTFYAGRCDLSSFFISSYGVLGRPVMIKHDGRIDECMQSLTSTEHVSDSWIAPFIHIQSFLTMMDEVHASMQTGGGKALVQVTCGSLQRHFNSVRTRVENDIAGCPSPTGMYRIYVFDGG